jgi:putative nucleotidyltransferase with HDIG domain
MGRAAFLLPAGVTVPESGAPPSMTNFSAMSGRERTGAGAGAAARVPAIMALLSRDEAWSLFCEWTESESLRRHVLAVEAAMRAYARKMGGDEELWGLTGMLHDLDYERFPDAETGHPRKAMEELERREQPPEMVRAIASHADYLHVSRDSEMEKALYAVDELSGFILACAYVRPEGIHGMTPKSVKKKMKTPAFAAAVGREEMREGAEALGVDFDEDVAFVISALEPHAAELGVDGARAG